MAVFVHTDHLLVDGLNLAHVSISSPIKYEVSTRPGLINFNLEYGVLDALLP